MLVWFLIVATLVLVAGIVFGAIAIVQSERHKDDLSKALAKTKTRQN